MFALSVVTAVLALVLSAVVGRQAKAIGGALGLVDRPDPAGGRKLHARPTPLVGGVAVALSVLAAALLCQIATATSHADLGAHIGWLAFAMAAMTMIGIGDDRHELSPRIRLVLSALVLTVVLYWDPRLILGSLQFDSWPPMQFGSLLFAAAFTIVGMVGLINAVNMADGKNGLVIGLGLIWASVLLWHAPAYLWPVLTAAIAALCVLLWFNLHSRLFLGDGGSYGISVLFGLLAIDIYNQPSHPMTTEEVALLFIVPVLDTIRLMAIRIVHKKSPFDGDRNHFHHFLADKFGWPEGLIAYLSLVGLPNLVATFVPGTGMACFTFSVFGYFALLVATRRDPAVVA